jgi:uncharacterized protein (DUF58 family)
MIAPAPRAALIFAAGVPFALLLVAAEPGWWSLTFDYGLIVIAVVATDAMLALPRRRLKATAKLPERLHVGETGAVELELSFARRSRPTRLELLLEQRGALDPATVETVTLQPAGLARSALPMAARRRGRVFVDAVWLRWRGPLRVVHRLPVNAAVDVIPGVRGVRNAALQFLSREALHGMKLEQQKGEGSEFDALREYVPGMDLRHVDWKHSARHRRLLCKEFQTERNHPVVMAFDTGHLMKEPVNGLARLDHAINAALALALVSLRGGDLVGLYGFDAIVRAYHAPVRGVARFGNIQRATAELAYRNEETNFTLGLAELNIRLKRRALVILFTEFIDTITAELMIESLQHVANRHVVVLVTLRDADLQRTVDAEPRSFEAVAEAVIAEDLQTDRAVVFERLERMGLHCLDTPSAGLSVALINRYLRIKQRGLI